MKGEVLLGLETSGPHGSVAVASGAEIMAQVDLPGRKHARTVMPAVARVLEEAGIRRDEVDGVAVGAGPGSFTGVRIAAATAKGLAHALGCPLWPVSSLLAAAVADLAVEGMDLPADSRERLVLLDARGDRVYAGGYRIGPNGLEVTHPPRAGTVGEWLEAEVAEATELVGDGAIRHRAAVEALGYAVLEPPAGVPGAVAVLYALRHLNGTPVSDPGRWEPDYLRDSSAERERRAGG